MTEEQLLTVLDNLLSTGMVRSIDLVEFNPKLDKENKTADICIRIVEFIATKL